MTSKLFNFLIKIYCFSFLYMYNNNCKELETIYKLIFENLIKKYDGYDDIISRLRSYLGNFDIQDFRQDYPELSNTSDLATAMYNDTKKFL